MNIRKFLLLALMLPAAGTWAQGNLGSLPKEVDVKDVIVTKVEYAIFSSHDSICVNPKTGQQDTLTVDEGMEIVTPEVFQAKREAKTAAIKKLVQQAKNRRALAPSVNADSDWHYEGQQERSMAQLYYYTYPSVDADGNPVRLSAMMGIPVNTVLEDYFDIISSTFSVFPWGNKIAPDWKVRPSNVVIGCHVTITSNWECPTSYESYGNSSLLGFDNFSTDAGMMLFYTRYDVLRQPCCLVILPDYEGYGNTVDRPHPYLYQELTARQCVDATRYGLALYNSKVASGDARQLENDWKTVCVGFSQGGSVSLATHKYIETNGLTDELHFAGSVCGDGPYSPVDHLLYYMTDDGTTYDGDNKTSHKAGRVSMPIVMPLILKGMLDSNPYMRQYSITQFLQQNFLNTGVIDFIEAKKNPSRKDQYSTVDVNKEFRKIILTRTHNGLTIHKVDSLFPHDDGENVHGSLEYMLTPECYGDFVHLTKNEAMKNTFMKDLVKALESNNLTKGWTPQKRIGFYHTTYDTVVPYVNLLTFIKNQDGLTYYFDDETRTRSLTAGVDPTHVGSKEQADVMIIDTDSKEDHVKAGKDFFLLSGVTSPDYELMKWVLEGKK